MDVDLDLQKLRTLVAIRNAAGLGFVPVTELMLALRRDGLTTVPLTDRIERTVVLAHRRTPAPQPGMRAVVDAVRDAVATGRQD